MALTSRNIMKAFDFHIFKTWQVQPLEMKSHQKNVDICICCRELEVSKYCLGLTILPQ